MPELPEVETVRIGLSSLLPGKKVIQVESDWAKSFQGDVHDTQTYLIGARIEAVKRRAKVLLVELSSEYCLVIHLKMTGQLVFRSQSERFGAGHPNASLVGELPDKSTRVTFTFDDGSKLFFNDQRKFGWVRLLPTVEVPAIDFFRRVGPEPLADDFTAKDFVVRIRRRPRSTIKAVLLDQTILAGVGNIYADESLWGAKIHPSTPVQDISDRTIATLFKSLQAVLRLSIEKGGSTDKNYVNAEGKRGSYLSFASVFRREGHACPRCGTTIIKLKVAGRGTHICPYCQRISKDTQ
jgi:formamidopyrimidine-DNA glycosylase